MRKIVVGNWKMHGFVTMAHPLVQAVLAEAERYAEAVEVVLCPPATLITRLAEWLAGTPVKIGGQDCHGETHGAFTGEISAPMLMDADCTHVIVGHSERRLQHGETNSDIAKKAKSAISAGLIPIICVGESAAERASGQQNAAVEKQLLECLPIIPPPLGGRLGGGHVESSSTQRPHPNPPPNGEGMFSQFILAYEPVWAIGSGKTPSDDDIRQMHAYITSVASQRIGLAPGQIPVLYGGSVKGDNAGAIMAIEQVAGVLVGGASLKAEEFCQIIRLARLEE